MPEPVALQHDVVKKWTAQIAVSDGFVFVTPEYNYGASAVLKNAIDWVYPEWNRKAAAFVSYGSAMGARSIQQLRETAIEIQMAPIRSSVHIPVATLWAHSPGRRCGKRPRRRLDNPANVMIDESPLVDESSPKDGARTLREPLPARDIAVDKVSSKFHAAPAIPGACPVRAAYLYASPESGRPAESSRVYAQ